MRRDVVIVAWLLTVASAFAQQNPGAATAPGGAGVANPAQATPNVAPGARATPATPGAPLGRFEPQLPASGAVREPAAQAPVTQPPQVVVPRGGTPFDLRGAELLMRPDLLRRGRVVVDPAGNPLLAVPGPGNTIQTVPLQAIPAAPGGANGQQFLVPQELLRRGRVFYDLTGVPVLVTPAANGALQAIPLQTLPGVIPGAPGDAIGAPGTGVTAPGTFQSGTGGGASQIQPGVGVSGPPAARDGRRSKDRSNCTWNCGRSGRSDSTGQWDR